MKVKLQLSNAVIKDGKIVDTYGDTVFEGKLADDVSLKELANLIATGRVVNTAGQRAPSPAADDKANETDEAKKVDEANKPGGDK